MRATELRRRGTRHGFVPTMGALHEGHASLIRQSLGENAVTTVSIFVNPAQFGPREDFSRYPRPLRNDVALLRRLGVPQLFLPSAREMYPDGFQTYVVPGDLERHLCGKCRPGHFRGVCTVVAKLLNAVDPDVAYFGRKDYQQALILGRMVKDMDMRTKVRVLPTHRDPDGLATSSRNVYLRADERRRALAIGRSLALAAGMAREGEQDARVIRRAMARDLSRSGLGIDYVEICDASTLEPVRRITGRTLAAVAVTCGKTRLIDNGFLRPGRRVVGDLRRPLFG
jgi:pantoate--beta-alanine ligase